MPRKLGQHFLTSQPILKELAVAACGDYTPRAVEIGAGRGALTGYLLERTDELHAIEIDPELVSALQSKFPNEPKLHIHAGDVLETDLAAWGPAVIAGNLPYYITSPIIERFVSLSEEFQRAVFLTQLEVAQRLLAGPGSRDYGYLTVVTQLVCDVTLVTKVPRGAFSPPPKVDSAAVRLTRRAAQAPNLKELTTFVGRCFRHKRKTLRNNLRPYYGAKIDGLPEAGLRAEQIALERFRHIYQELAG